MGEKSTKEIHEEFTQSLKQQKEEAIQVLEQLASSVDAAYLFLAVAANMVFLPAPLDPEKIFGAVTAKLELLAYHLYPYFGTQCDQKVTPYHTNACIEAINKLFVADHLAVLEKKAKDGFKPESEIIGHAESEARFVRGSAYPEQTEVEIKEIQGKYEKWFTQRLGIGPIRAVELIWQIVKKQEENLNAYTEKIREYSDELKVAFEEAKHKGAKTKEDHDLLRVFKSKKTAGIYGALQGLNDISQMAPVASDDLECDGTKVVSKEWQILQDLIGLTPDRRCKMTDPVEVRDRPLFVLPDGRFLLLDISHAMDVLWDRFEEVLSQNTKLFQKYQTRKSKWLEDKIYDSLLKLFPKETVHRNLSYPDPDKHDGATAEIDSIVLWGPFLVLIEAKARQFRIEGRLGDAGRLRTDVKVNIADPFEQARRTLRYIERTELPKFTEKFGKQTLMIEKSKINRTYLMTISQHHLGGTEAFLSDFKGWGLFQDGQFPFCACAADLEIVTEFCEGAEVFLHYIEKMLNLRKTFNKIFSDSLGFFGAYLDIRLQKEKFLVRGGKKPDWIALFEFSDQFDDWMKFKRGESEESPSIKLRIPDEIREILVDLRRHSHDDSAKWIAFSLLDLSDRTLNAVAIAFREIRASMPERGMFRRVTFEEGETVISIVSAVDLPRKLLQQRTAERALIEKYKRKKYRTIGLGTMILDVQPVECIFWAERPWEYDQQMEKALENEAPFWPSKGQKLPDRNSPCICGSGKKFKRCCLIRLEKRREQ